MEKLESTTAGRYCNIDHVCIASTTVLVACMSRGINRASVMVVVV
jgi:hypothetical protein